MEGGGSEIDLPFYFSLDANRSIDLRPCIDLKRKSDDVELIDIRRSWEYLNPVRTPTFNHIYDVPTDDEWKLRRSEGEPGPGSTVPVYNERIPGGLFSSQYSKVDPRIPLKQSVKTHLAPGFYDSSVGRYSRPVLQGGTFSKAPNINSTERAARKAATIPSYYDLQPLKSAPCLVNFNTQFSLKSSPTVNAPSSAENLPKGFGSGLSTTIREDSVIAPKIAKFKSLLNDQRGYFSDRSKEEHKHPQTHPRPTKVQIMYKTLQRCEEQIMRALDTAGEEEMGRCFRKRPACELKNFQRDSKSMANRRISEANIKKMLEKRNKLRKAYKLALIRAGFKPEELKVTINAFEEVDLNLTLSEFNDINSGPCCPWEEALNGGEGEFFVTPERKVPPQSKTSDLFLGGLQKGEAILFRQFNA